MYIKTSTAIVIVIVTVISYFVLIEIGDVVYDLNHHYQQKENK